MILVHVEVVRNINSVVEKINKTLLYKGIFKNKSYNFS